MIHYIPSRPADYHCTCIYCKNLFRGELIQQDGEYYSARKRAGYSEYERKHKHLDKGHWQGYAFIAEHYSKPGDTVFDPCAGTGTALIEAMKLGRKGVGIELEFFNILAANTNLYPETDSEIFKGDARIMIDKIEKNSIDLIITGTPYNNDSDAPERKNLKGGDKSFNYDKNLPNIAWLKDQDYFEEILKLYTKCAEKLKKGGHFAIIIKDPVRGKKAYLLHQLLARVMEDIPGLEVRDVWIHKHYPPTLFINTYQKRFPDVKIPLYQTMVVLKKK